jgi:hypothetical protein
MGLINPFGPSWAYCTHNLPSPPDAAALGTSCAPGVNNADGAAVTLLPALAHDVEYLKLAISLSSSGGANNDILMDVLVDPAGGTSWTTLIPHLIAGALCNTSTSTTQPSGPSGFYDFPVWIKAGSSLGIQARTAHSAAQTLKVAAYALGGNANPASWWCGQRISSIGVNASASTGTLHTGGSSGAFSSWTDFGSPLAADCGALQWGVNGEGDGVYSGQAYQFEFGAGGTKIGAPMFRALTAGENGWVAPTGPIFRRLGAGTQLQVRAACGGAAQALGVAAYAVH